MQIYADNAATTKMSRTAIDAMLRCMEADYGNPSSLYTIGQQAKEILEQARADVAAVINAEPREILFTSGGSEADNQAIRSAAALGQKTGKKHIISTAFEHHAVLHTLKKLEQEGFEVTLLDVHTDGLVRPEEVEAAIREDTCLVTDHVRQQRDRHHPAHPGDRRNLQKARRPLPHRRGAGSGPRAHRRQG